MSNTKLESFRSFLTERFTTVAVEIFGEIESIVEAYYEENKRLRNALHMVLNPEIKLPKIDFNPYTGATTDVRETITQEEVPEPLTKKLKEEQIEYDIGWGSEQQQGLGEAVITTDCVKNDPEEEEDASMPYITDSFHVKVVEFNHNSSATLTADEEEEHFESESDGDSPELSMSEDSSTESQEPQNHDTESRKSLTALHLLNDLNEGESDGGEVSGLSDLSRVDSGSDGSSSDGEPPRKARPPPLSHPPLEETHPPSLRGDGPITALEEVCATEPSPAQETGKDGTVWTLIQSDGGTGNEHIQNVPTESAGPTPYARHNICDKLTAFRCLCDDIMFEHIQECTIAEARRAGGKRADWDVSLAELKAFIALLYVRGAHCGKNIDIDSFWAEQWGNAFFTTTLSRNRFREIMRYLRFDHKETRPCRVTTDKFVHMREVWDRFVQNSIACYRPGADITVGEQLFPTKARCPFTQYMPNKPEKFGIKFLLAVDADSRYMLNGIPYLGKDDGENVVLKLVEPFTGKGRNVTTDSVFTSLPLANALLCKNTSLVGMIDKNKRELPPSVRGRMELFSTKVLKHNKVVLSVYQCKPKRNVTILSSQHQHVAISTDTKKKPETVSYYNHTKVEFDMLDQMARQYSVKGGAHRWPVAAFYNVLDFAAINAWVLYQSCMNDDISRRDFMLQLAQELRAEWMALKEPPAPAMPYPDAEERRRVTCMVKAQCKQNKTFCKCLRCGNAVCGKCTAMKPKWSLQKTMLELPRMKPQQSYIPDPAECQSFLARLTEAFKDFPEDQKPLITKMGLTKKVELVDCAFGKVPKGCPLSYQCPVPSSRDYKIHDDAPPRPLLPLAHHKLKPMLAFPTLCAKEQKHVNAMQINWGAARNLEHSTRGCKDAIGELGNLRLTSRFREICKLKPGRSNAEHLIYKIQKGLPRCKTAQIEEETKAEALRDYCKHLCVNWSPCGLVVHPNAPWLGAMPDGLVYDPKEMPNFGLVHVKCIGFRSFIECKFLLCRDGVLQLKRSHSHYWHIQGEMMVTGMEWCDLLVCSGEDILVQRIYRDTAMIKIMKKKLDDFFFYYYLPCLF